MATTGAWSGPDLTRMPGRSVCVAVVHGEPAVARGRICVASRNGRDGRDGLSFTPLEADGTARATRRLAARVTRPAPNVLEAVFLPAAAGLPLGAYGWWARASWTDGADCARTCDDRLRGRRVARPARRSRLLRRRRARSRGPCDSADLRLAVDPPRRAYVVAAPYCDTTERSGLITACGFGAAPADAAATFAIVGDSHAAGMKTPLHVLTLARRWRGVSILRSSCPATLACRGFRGARSRECLRWNQEALRPDPLVAAARGVRSPLVKVVDLTREFCDRRRCPAVVGGALVNRNTSHLSPLFAATLGPFLLRAVDG